MQVIDESFRIFEGRKKKLIPFTSTQVCTPLADRKMRFEIDRSSYLTLKRANVGSIPCIYTFDDVLCAVSIQMNILHANC
jgi:hypothetical protein